MYHHPQQHTKRLPVHHHILVRNTSTPSTVLKTNQVPLAFLGFSIKPAHLQVDSLDTKTEP